MNDDALAKLMGFKDGDYTGGAADRERQAKIDAEYRKAHGIKEMPKVQQIHKTMLSNAIRNQQINDIDAAASDWCVCSSKSGALTLEWIYYVSLSTLEVAGFKPMEKETVVLRKISTVPIHPKKSNEPTQYHCYDSCNACGGVNNYQVTSADEGHLSECETECKNCGHKDYWAHGFFESSAVMDSKCNKYSLGVRNNGN